MGVLAEKRLVIMGGTSGLGLSAAQAMSEAGARLVVVGWPEDVLSDARQRLADRALVLAGDATQPQTAEKAIRCCLENFGGFDGLYHVAGGSGRRFGDAPLHEMSDEGWDYTVRLNQTSVAYSNRAAIREWLRMRRGGTLLNLTSVLALAPSPRHFATHAYAAAKAAIIGLSRSLAAYYAPHDIRINVLAPGLVETPMSTRAAQDPAIAAFIKRKQPLDGGRIGLPADLDALAVYFMSDASRFVTGQVLAVDGGWTVSEGLEDPA